MYYSIRDALATAGAEFVSADVKPMGEKPANCKTEYIKLAISEDEDLDFEIKSRFGDVKYNVRRVLHYMKDTNIRTGFLGLYTIMKPLSIYEIEIYKANI